MLIIYPYSFTQFENHIIQEVFHGYHIIMKIISSKIQFIQREEEVIYIFSLVKCETHFKYNQDKYKKVSDRKAVFVSDYYTALWKKTRSSELSLDIGEQLYYHTQLAHPINKNRTGTRMILIKMQYFQTLNYG